MTSTPDGLLLVFGVAWRLFTGHWTMSLAEKKGRKRIAPFIWGFFAGIFPVLGGVIVPHVSQDAHRPYSRITGNYIYAGIPWTIVIASLFLANREQEAFLFCVIISLVGYAAYMGYALVAELQPYTLQLTRLAFSDTEIMQVKELAKLVDSDLQCRVLELNNEGKGSRLLRLSLKQDLHHDLDFDITKNHQGFLVRCKLKDGTVVVQIASKNLDEALKNAASAAEEQGVLSI